MKDVLKRLIRANYKQRMTIEELYAHPILTFDWAIKNKPKNMKRELIGTTKDLVNKDDSWYYKRFDE